MVLLERYTPDEWKNYSKECHALVFEELRDSSLDRISYALLAYDDLGPIGYVTCRELDSESVYWQYGGAVKERRGLAAVRGFEVLINHTTQNYKRVSTYVKNDNVGYLHLLMKMGFRVIGLRYFGGNIYLELFKEL